MTKNRATKTAARARQAATGEPFTAALRGVTSNARPGAIQITLPRRVRFMGLGPASALPLGGVSILAGRPQDDPAALARLMHPLPFGTLRLLLSDKHAWMSASELTQHVADFVASAAGRPALVIVDRTAGLPVPDCDVPANTALLFVCPVRSTSGPVTLHDVRADLGDLQRAELVMLLDRDKAGRQVVRVGKSRRGLGLRVDGAPVAAAALAAV